MPLFQTVNRHMAHTPRTTLKDVAALAGVSTCTASRALTGQAHKYRLSEKTVERVRAAAAQLNFMADPVARSLRTQRSGLLGVMVPDISHPFFAQLAREISCRVVAHQFATVLCDSCDDPVREAQVMTHLIARKVEGMIVCPVSQDREAIINLIPETTAAVVIDPQADDLPFTCLSSNDQYGARLAIRHLHELGHQRIGILQGNPDAGSNAARLAGVRAETLAAGFEARAMPIFGESFSQRSGYISTQQLLAADPTVTALFAFSDQIALGCLQALGELDIAIPHDMSLIGFDDAPFTRFLNPPLTVIRQPVVGLGERAVELLMQQIESENPIRLPNQQLAVELVVRSSVHLPRA